MREERAMNYSGTAKLQNSTQMSPAQLHRVFFPILLAIFLPHVSFVAAAEVISCVTASSGQPLTLDDSQINDGYCDCIDTGADEPQTSACSGMEEWPSVLIYPIARCVETTMQSAQTACNTNLTRTLYSTTVTTPCQSSFSALNNRMYSYHPVASMMIYVIVVMEPMKMRV